MPPVCKSIRCSFEIELIPKYKYNSKMEEIIEAKEGDTNIELGIQVLPEQDENDDYCMDDDEKYDFINNTTISWFKDDVKLDDRDADTRRLFNFCFDKSEGFHKLIVKKASKETEGVYKCIVENEGGTSSCSTKLVVGPGNKPKLTSKLSDVELYVGQSLEFRIKSRGLPIVECCQWFKDDILISESKFGSKQSSKDERISIVREEEEYESENSIQKLVIFKLSIEDIRLDDAGRYKCKIINENGSDESECYVKVLQEIIEEYEETEESIEETRHLGGGKQSIRMQEEIYKQEEEEQIATSAENNRKEKRFKAQTDELYEEKSSSIINNESSDDFKGKAPKFVQLLHDFVITEEEVETRNVEMIVSTRIDEYSNSSDNLFIKWYVNNVEITKGTRRHEYEIETFVEDKEQRVFKHVLVLKAASGANGEFKCVASNKYGESETSCRVTLNKEPRIARGLNDVDTQSGQTIKLKFALDETEETTKADEVKFIKDGKVIYSTSDQSSTKKLKSGSRIIVESFEEIIEHESKTRRYSLRRYSKSLSPKVRAFELTIENIQTDDAGNWLAEASNKAGKVSCDCSVTVTQDTGRRSSKSTTKQSRLEEFDEEIESEEIIEISRPRLLNNLNDVEAYVGQNLKFLVKTSGQPEVDLCEWYKDDELLVDSSTTKTKRRRSSTSKTDRIKITRSEEGYGDDKLVVFELSIDDLKLDDAGKYKCRILNKSGYDESECSLKVLQEIIEEFEEIEELVDENNQRFDKTSKHKTHQDKPKKTNTYIDEEMEEDELIEEQREFESSSKRTKRKTSTQEESATKDVIEKESIIDSNDEDSMESTRYKKSKASVKKEKLEQEVDLEDNSESPTKKFGYAKQPRVPKFNKKLENMTITEEEVETRNVELVVSTEWDDDSDSKDKLTIKWFFNDKEILKNSHRHEFEIEDFINDDTNKSFKHILVLKSANKADGTFECSATNKNGTSETSARIKLAKKPKFAQEWEDMETIVGETVILTTIIDSTDDAAKANKIKVLHDGKLIVSALPNLSDEIKTDSGSKIKLNVSEDVPIDNAEAEHKGYTTRRPSYGCLPIVRQVELTITNVQPDQSGTWEVVAENDVGPESCRADLEVFAEPKIVKNLPRELKIQPGEDLNMSVEVSGLPEPVVGWYKDGQGVAEDEACRVKTKSEPIETLGNTSTVPVTKEELVIKDCDEKDSGIYKCIVENRLGEMESSELKVQVGEPKSMTDDEVLENEKTVSRHPISRKSSIGTAQLSKPNIVTDLPESIGLKEGDELALKVEIVGEPLAQDISWFKDGQPIDLDDDRVRIDSKVVPKTVRDTPSSPYNRRRSSTLTPKTVDAVQQQLIIDNIKPEDAGVYTCEVKNDLGEAKANPTVVDVLKSPKHEEDEPMQVEESKPANKPKIINDVPESLALNVGDKVCIPLTVEKSPNQDVAWFKDGEPIDNKIGDRIHTESEDKKPKRKSSSTTAPQVTELLVIDDAKPEDTGVYSCKVTNPAGQVKSGESIVVISDGSETPIEKSKTLGRFDRPIINDLSESEEMQMPEQPSSNLEEQPSGERGLKSQPDQRATSEDLAQNDISSAAPETSTEFSAKPKIVRNLPRQLTIQPGKDLNMSVEVSGLPEPVVGWHKDGRKVVDNEDGRIETRSEPIETQGNTSTVPVTKKELVIKDCDEKDSGIYKCIVENGLGEVESCELEVQVGEPKSMTGDEVPINEDAQDTEHPASRKTSIAKAQPGKPNIVTDLPESLGLKEGDFLALKVEVVGELLPQDISWFKDGQPIDLDDDRVRIDSKVVPKTVRDTPSSPYNRRRSSTLTPKTVDAVQQQLIIDNIKPEDAGVYTCGVENDLGEAKTNPTVVDVLKSPKHEEDEPMQVEESKPVNESKNMNDMPGEGLMQILEPSVGIGERPSGERGLKSQPDQRTTSEDLAQNDISSAAPETSTEFSAKPKIVRNLPRQLTIQPGEDLNMSVEVSGLPEPVVGWHKDGRKVVDNEDGRIETRSEPIETLSNTSAVPVTKEELVIKDCDEKDSGIYKCIVENGLGEVESCELEVQVGEPKSMTGDEVPINEDAQDTEHPASRKTSIAKAQPGKPNIVTDLPESLGLKEGDFLALKVEVVGELLPQDISWFKDGQPIDLDDDRVRIDSKVVPKTVRDTPSSPYNRRRSSTLTPKTVDAVQQQLIIDNIKPEDAGVYTCGVENDLGEAKTNPTVVDVLKSPKHKEDEPMQVEESKPANKPKIINDVPESLALNVGDKVCIPLTVEKSPNQDVAWFKDGEPIDNKIGDRIHTESEDKKPKRKSSSTTAPQVTELLVIDDAKPEDTGVYSCKVTNPAGQVKSGESIVVISDGNETPDVLKQPAAITDKSNDGTKESSDNKVEAPKILRLNDQEALPNSTVRLEAEVSGNPKPNIKWLKDGDEVELNILNEVPNSNIHSLTLKNVNDLYDGIYTVEARNIAGVARKDARVSIVDKLSSKQEPDSHRSYQQDLEETEAKDKNDVFADQTMPEKIYLPEQPLKEIEELPFIKRGLKFSQVNEGKAAKLEVQIEGPYDEIIWMKDGERIDVDSNSSDETSRLVPEGLSGDIQSELTINDVGQERGASSPTIEESEATTDLTKSGSRNKTPRFLLRPSNKRAPLNSEIAFEVIVSGNPKPKVVWYKNGKRIEPSEDDRIRIEEFSDGGSRLVIDNITHEDEAVYAAEAINDIDQVRSETVSLTVTEDTEATSEITKSGSKCKAPRFLLRPSNKHAPLNSKIAFEVIVSGNPKPKVIWYKNGKLIEPSEDDRIRIEEFSDGGSRLVIDNITHEDEAVYAAEAINDIYQVRSETVSLTVTEDTNATSEITKSGPRNTAPRFLLRPSNKHAPLNSKISFEVIVTGSPEPKVVWYKNGKRIEHFEDDRVIIEEFSDGGSRLIIDYINNEDQAEYVAEAINDVGKVRSETVSLTVIEETEATTDLTESGSKCKAPRFLLRPSNKRAPLNSKIAFEVIVSGNPKPKVIWYKNGKRIEPSEDDRIRIEEFSDGGSRLVIDNITHEDEAEYAAEAINAYGNERTDYSRLEVIQTIEEETITTTTTTTASQKFASDVPRDGRCPRFLLRPKNKRQPLGSKVEFEVKVSGTPKPDIIWYKNGRKIHYDADGRVRCEQSVDDASTSRLIIDDIRDSDEAVYSAEAINSIGLDRTGDVQLKVVRKTQTSEHCEVVERGTTIVKTKTKRTRNHYVVNEEPRTGYVCLTINEAQLDDDGDYKLIVKNKWGQAQTHAPLVVIPRVELRHTRRSVDRSTTADNATSDGRDSRSRRTPFDELDDFNHELDRSVGVFGSESKYQSGEDTYLLQLRDTEFPLRLRKYLRFGARQSPSLRSNLMDSHWGGNARVTIRERRKFTEVMDEEIDDEKHGLDFRPTPMRLQKEVGTLAKGAEKLERLRLEAAERRVGEGSKVDKIPPFFREKLQDCIVKEGESGKQEAVFSCLAYGQPKPEYSWFNNDNIIAAVEGDFASMTSAADKNRFSIKTDERGGSELHIRDPRLFDAGCFKCVARNEYGSVTSRARLRVATEPTRPEPPEALNVGSRDILLTWKPPRQFDVNVAEILGYKLEMSESSIGQDDQWQVLAPDIGREFFIVDSLTPATSYSFRISARNKFGVSPSSYSAYVTTRKDASERVTMPQELRDLHYSYEDCSMEQYYEDYDYNIEQQPVPINGGDESLNLLDKYSLKSEISRGRFSLIARAASKENGRNVVVKIVDANSSQSAQIKNEFDILRSLQHEKIVILFDAYKNDQYFAFVMQKLSGLDVLSYLSMFTVYTEETISKIITQVMDALEYLHFRAMCLLELQPDNVVMVDGRSTLIKLVDFSSARFVPKSGARVPVNISQIVEFCSPEVIAQQQVSTASDVWCVGVLTYILLSGHSPFKGDSLDETTENVRLGRYKYDSLYKNCTPEVTRFLINVFKKHSSKRPTIEQLYENKWLLPNEFMIKKRQQAVFKTDRIIEFASEFHKSKRTCNQQKLFNLLSN